MIADSGEHSSLKQALKPALDWSYTMTAFSPNMIVPAAKSNEFAGDTSNKRTVKAMLLDGIKRQVELFKDPKADGRRWFQVGKVETAISLRVQNKSLKLIGDESKVVVPTEHVEAAFTHYAAEVTADKFKDQLAELQKSVDARRDKASKTRAANKGKKAD
jgi:hypothetical protein